MKKIYLLTFALIGAISNVFTAQAEDVVLPLSWSGTTAQTSFVQGQNKSPYNQIVKGTDDAKKEAVEAFFADNTLIGDRRLVWGTGQQTSGYGWDLENITSTGFDYKGRNGISGEFVAQIYDMEHAASAVNVSFNADGDVSSTTFSIWKIRGGVATKLASTSANFSKTEKNTITTTGNADIQKNDRLVLMWTGSSGGQTVNIINFSASYTHTPDSYNLTVGATGWATIYLDFNAIIPTGVKVYGVTANQGGTKAQLTEVSGVIAANKGYLVNGAATNYTFDEPTVATEPSAVETSLLGSVNDSYVQGAAYVLADGTSGVGFYKATLNKNETGNTGSTHFKNNANKAYLPASGAGARVLTFDFDDNAETGINAVEIEEAAPANAAIYDLGGRRVQNAKSGLYIINGKKVIK